MQNSLSTHSQHNQEEAEKRQKFWAEALVNAWCLVVKAELPASPPENLSLNRRLVNIPFSPVLKPKLTILTYRL